MKIRERNHSTNTKVTSSGHKHLKCVNAGDLVLTNYTKNQADSSIIDLHITFALDAHCKYENYLIFVSIGSVLYLPVH